MWTVYVLKHNITGQIYIGKTNNLRRRIQEHNTGQQKATYRQSGYWFLVYAEAFRSRLDAYDREQKLKNHGRAKQELFKRINRSFKA